MRRRSSSVSLSPEVAVKSAGRSESPAATARAVAAIDLLLRIAQERFHPRDELRREHRERQQHERGHDETEADAVDEVGSHGPLELHVQRERTERVGGALAFELARVRAPGRT